MFVLAGTLLALAQAGPSDEEAEAFARAFVADVVEGRGTAVDARCDQKAAVDAAAVGVELPEDFLRGFRIGLAKTPGFGLGPVLTRIVAAGGTYTLLRVRRADGRPKALVRLIQADGALNYHDLHIGGEAGAPRVVDLYVYATSDRISEIYGRMMRMALAAEPGKLGKLMGRENEVVKGMPALQAFYRLFQQQKFQEAYDAFDDLHPTLREEKNVLFIRATSAVRLGAEETATAFEAFRRAFPEEPCLDMLSIDAHLMKKAYSESVASVDRLDRRVGGDPYLQVMRGNIRRMAGELDRAVEHGRKAIESEKTLGAAYELLLTISLEKKDFDETARLLAAYERDAGVTLNDLSQIEAYAGFLASDAGRAWLKSRAEE